MKAPVKFAALSVFVSFVVLAVKLGAWWTTDSSVLLADAAESMLDVFTSGLLLFAVRLASQPADAKHPWGHGKIEYLSSGFQGGLILMAAIGVGVEAGRGLYDGPEALELGVGLALSTFATVLNLALALSLLHYGTKLRSPALVADGHPNLADVWTTIGGWVGLGITWLTGWWLLDGIVALLVAAWILRTGLVLLWASLQGLLDASLEGPDLTVLTDALHQVVAGCPGCKLTSIRARESSHQTFVECTLEVPGEMTVHDSHAICDALEVEAERVRPGAEVQIHVEPAN